MRRVCSHTRHTERRRRGQQRKWRPVTKAASGRRAAPGRPLLLSLPLAVPPRHRPRPRVPLHPPRVTGMAHGPGRREQPSSIRLVVRAYPAAIPCPPATRPQRPRGLSVPTTTACPDVVETHSRIGGHETLILLFPAVGSVCFCQEPATVVHISVFLRTPCGLAMETCTRDGRRLA